MILMRRLAATAAHILSHVNITHFYSNWVLGLSRRMGDQIGKTHGLNPAQSSETNCPTDFITDLGIWSEINMCRQKQSNMAPRTLVIQNTSNFDLDLSAV